MATRERMIVEALMRALRLAQVEDVADRVFEDRGFSIAATELPALDVMVMDDDQEVLDLDEQQLEHQLRIEVAAVVCERFGQSPSSIADPIAAAAHRTVRTDAALAALVRAITPGPVRVTRQTTGDGVVLRRAMTYTFDHVTLVDDLEAAP